MSRRKPAVNKPPNHRTRSPRELPNVGPCEEEPTPCNNGPLDGIEDDDDEDESHEELDGAP